MPQGPRSFAALAGARLGVSAIGVVTAPATGSPAVTVETDGATSSSN